MGDRVLQLLGPSTGGIRRHVIEISNRLRDRAWDVTVAGPAGVVDESDLDHAVEVPSTIAAPSSMISARRQLRGAADGVDLIHAHGLKAGWLASTLPNRPPLVVTVHNLVLRESAGRAAPLLRLLEGRLPSRSDRVIAVSQEIADRFGRPPHMAVIPPAGPVPVVRRAGEDVRAELGIPARAPLAVNVARLHPQKDVPTLLLAAAQVAELHVAIVGVGPLDHELRDLAHQLAVGDRVHFTGQHDNPADVMAAADVVVVTSLWESGPLALVEAMALGRPVVTTPVGLAQALVIDRDTGRMVAIGDAAAVAEAIEWVLADPSRAGAMGERGRAAVNSTLGADRLVADIESVYRLALAR